MPEYIQERKLVEITRYAHSFDYEYSPGAGYSFGCDENGNVIKWDSAEPSPVNGLRVKSFIETGRDDEGKRLIYKGIEKYTNSYWEPAIIRCVCGGEVPLEFSLTNTCEKCGRDYNLSGQLLADRSQWGEDTGESLSEIMQANRRIK